MRSRATRSARNPISQPNNHHSFRRSRLLIIALLTFLLTPPFVVRLIQKAQADTSTPVSITSFGTPVTENFDSLVSAGTSSTTPTGWGFSESGTNANTTYTAGTGSGTAGDTYSFGNSADRAFGGLQSGTLIPILGATFVNNTGGTITSLGISYTGEQWRLGTSGRTDRLDFQISTNATSLTSGTYTDNDALDFSGPISAGTVGALNGNLAANRTGISSTITGLSIPNGASFWIRWTDFNASGADDGLAIEDFSLTANGNAVDTAPSVSTTNPTNGATNVANNSDINITFSEPVNVTGDWFQISCATSGTRLVADTAVSGGPAAFNINPTNDFAFSELCTVTVVAGQVSDQDANDPPDNMTADHLFSFTTAGAPPVAPGSVVISQVYAGGGNAGATLKNDFIEIINHTGAPINLSGWSVQYASATLGAWSVTPLTNFNLQPGQYYLIQEAQGAAGTVDLPTPDATGAIAMGATAGKVALVSNTTPLSGTCPSGTSIIDFVGYGTTANCFEGPGPTTAPSNTTAVARDSNGCTDTNNNAADFSAGAPGPRNSSSPTNDCSLLSGIGSANPFGVQAGDSSTLTVVVSPASNPTSTGITVTADLSLIGGSAAQPFSGVGNTFSFFATVAVGTTPGLKNLPATITDAQARTANTTIPLLVQQPHVVISQIYGGGGNGGATYTNDYIELYNPSGVTFDLTGWSLQYTSAAGDGWEFTRQPIGGTIASGEYYLIALSSGGSDGDPLPVAPNISGDINMSGTAGKVALVSNFDALEGTCPLGDPDIVDFVGYGPTANCAETANAPSPSNTTAILRLNNGATDTDNNQSDFAAGAPNPRRTAPIVELGPAVFSTDPRNNGFNAPRDANITVNFTEPVDVVGSWFNINCATTGLHNDATFAGANKTYIIIPNVNFLAGEQCTVTILKDQIHDQDTDDSGPNTDTLSANYVFSFTVATGTAPAYPPDVHLTMGNPNGATADSNQPNNYLMEKPEFALSYNRDNGGPNWVSWHLADEWVGTLPRFDTFRADPAVLPTWYRVLGTDFSGSGFDRGHMVPNADRDKETSSPINQATFLMSNMLAQSPDNNQGPWADFENYLRSLLPANEIYIVAGPAGTGGTGSNGFATTIANGHVHVPASTWKVVLVIPKGNNDVSRVTAASRTIAIEIPNVQGIRTNPWEQYLTTVDAVENLTGYNFFSNVPDAIENAIEAGTNGSNPPGTTGQAVTTAEDVSVTITLDSASPGGPLTYTIVTPPAHGSLNGSNGSRDYTPNPDFNGDDSFTFKVNDGVNDSNISTVNITVTEVNDAPTASDDSDNTNEDTTLNFAASVLTGNDSAGPANESGQTLTVTDVIATGNTHGTVSLNSGQISFSPDANFNGPASFQYQVCDNGSTNGVSDSLCTLGTVNITVNPVNDGPTANSQSVTTNANTPVGITLTGSDVETPPTSLGFNVTLGPTHGSLSGTAPNLTYTPAANYSGPDSFKFTVTDTGDGSAAALTSSEATVSITVNDTVAPTITAPANVNLGTGAGSTSCSLVISDATLGTAMASDNSGSVSVSRTGVPAGNVFPVGTTIVTYTATDAANNSASATQSVTVFDNTAPTLTAPAPTSATANGSGQAPIPNVLPQVVAADNCSAVTLQQSPTAGTLVGVGTHTITITGTDAAGNSRNVTTTFTVNPNNNGLTFTLSVTPSSVKRGKIATLKASFNNGTGTLQLVTFKLRYNSPCGNATIGNIGPIPIAAGAHGNTSLPFLVPKNACTGLYTLTLESYVGGVLVNSTTAQLTVTN